jgi:hypothetical protein
MLDNNPSLCRCHVTDLGKFVARLRLRVEIFTDGSPGPNAWSRLISNLFLGVVQNVHDSSSQAQLTALSPDSISLHRPTVFQALLPPKPSRIRFPRRIYSLFVLPPRSFATNKVVGIRAPFVHKHKDLHPAIISRPPRIHADRLRPVSGSDSKLRNWDPHGKPCKDLVTEIYM